MFVDTNVLVYARFVEAPNHQLARGSLENALAEGEPVRISRQVFREYLAVVTRPQTWSVPIARNEALGDIERLADSFEVLEDGRTVTDWLLLLCRRIPVGGKQIHDANIVATMLAYGEDRLLTFNEADFRRFQDHIQLVEPTTN
ncbi:MAG: type II toxin-antitoxin system VapC family toxin [Chloroflexi bacterium]|nr:type II toxin-antitoxin system VapC family toxin [Chloroflexota bacterium]